MDNQPDNHLWHLYHHLRAAVDQVDEGVVFLEAEGDHGGEGPRVLFVNRGICSLTGFRGEDLLGSPLAALFKGDKLPLLLERLSAVAGAGHAYEVASPLGCASGIEVPARWKVSGVRGPKGEPLSIMLTVSVAPVAPVESGGEAAAGGGAEVPVEVLAGEPCEMRTARMETLALLAGGIAHDFKNILTTVMANLSLVREAMGEGALRNQIEDAAKASESGCRMAEQLLRFARGGGGGERIEADLGQLLKEAARLATYGANARCEVVIDPDLWSAEVNVTQVTQVINNLVINARQAMGDVGTFQAKVGNVEIGRGEVDGVAPGKYVKLEVSDHGCGIPADKLEDIFKPFYTTKKTGNGLGLATCATVVREHGGTIEVVSVEGRGTAFTVYLPATGEAVEADEGGREPEGEIIRSSGGAVLVVDDQAPIRNVAKSLLLNLGYEADCAASGEEGVARYRRRRGEGRPFGAVLMDLTLPGGIDGCEAARQILAMDPEAKLIVSSGYLQDSMTDEQREAGFVAILSKPYDLQKVSRVLHEVFDEELLLD